MITFTEAALEKINELLKGERQGGLALRMAIRGRGPGGFNYKLGFVREEDHQTDDAVVEARGFKVYIDPETVPNLENSTIDFVDGLEGTGFKIDNPNPLWGDPVAMAVQQILDTEINPTVAMHGGHVTLLEVKEETAYIQFGGGCQGCGMADVTLKQGVELRIKEAVPQIKQVLDTTEHAAGKNPYYRGPEKGGGSPYDY
ncbi:MAG: iron-sulfur cluster assembly accessory protein [Planctomycetes bacterium]|nr:iron-sulfur cluster assembly accessory protein [Planctomycetota bacterium]